jgi:uncharacterized protein (TIGR03437 family)
MKRTVLACAAIAVCFAMPAPAYYYFVHYLNGGNVVEKFNLSALPNSTVTFFVSESGPTVYSQTDTFNSLLGQIEQATKVWNGVASSALRVSFGGMESKATPQSTPGGDVMFEELPPGVEGYGGPTTLTSTLTNPDGSQYYPIVRTALYLDQNLTVAPGPSYDQSFLMTTLHEIGHALGLQHTFTSSTMSQATTRATNLTRPLDNDDIAGISALYPNANFAQFGSITGSITAGGNGVHLASVVAIQAGAGAVSGVTNPDGSFRIDGVPPGNYFVYVHTMPPDANVLGPWNADGSTAAVTGPVNALFYPGTTNLTAATPVAVQAGTVTSGIDIATTTRAAVPFYDGQIYGYLNGTVPITPAPVNITALPPMAASVTGLTATNGQIPGLSVTVIGGALSFGTQPYLANGYTYVALYPTLGQAPPTGPAHVIFTTPDYMYVLPSGINLTQNNPPAITAATANGDGTLTVTGSGWASSTQIYFDSLPASILSLDPKADVAVVVPPPGSNNQLATVTAYNSDGQNSQFLQAASPIQYSYGSAQPPQSIALNPASLPAGAESMVDITATGAAFAQGLTTVGFGTSDIVVRRVFVLSPNHLQVDVSVSAGAALTNTDFSVLTGFQLATLSGVFQITASSAGLPAAIPTLVNAWPGLTGSYAGAIVSLYGTNLAAPNAVPAITIGGLAATILYASPGQINLVIPATLTPGPAIMQLNNGLANAYPVVVNIDMPPAGIDAIQNASGAYIYSGQAAHPGDTLIVTLSNFAPSGSNIALSRVQVSVGGTDFAPTQIVQIGTFWQVTFVLNSSAPLGASEPLIVYLDGRSSVLANIPVANPDGSFTPLPALPSTIAR